MNIAIVAGKTVDITHLLTACTWSGDRTQAARKLVFSFLQDDRDENIPVIDIDNGYTVVAGDDGGNIVFVGNVYDIEKDRAQSRVNCTCYDHLFVLNRSKTTRKFSNALPEDIAKGICSEMGVQVGNIAATGVPVSFIANGKTGYQIIMSAYTEAKKKNEKLYQCIMNGAALDIIEKGNLVDGLVLDASANMTDSIYHESIEEIINAVLIADEQGNSNNRITDDESIRKYSMFQTIYKNNPEKDAQSEAKDMFKKPEREGNVTAFGDYRAKSGYSLIIRDTLFTGKFWIKSDTHTFDGGYHEMKLKLEFENLMSEEKAEQEKSDNSSEQKTTTAESGDNK